MHPLASRLVGPQGVPAFNADMRERQTAKFEAALTATEAASLFDMSRLQQAISGPGLPAAQTDVYRADNMMRLSDVIKQSGATPLDAARDLVKIGCTLRFRDVDQYDRDLADFIRDVAGTYAAEVQANVYLTPPGQHGFRPHFDNSDAFIVQVAGSKNWLIHGDYTDRQVLPGPDVDWDPVRFRPVGSATALVMRVGDVLYIPRGVMHSAHCTDEESMHLTVSLTPMTVLGLIEKELRRLATEDVALRQRAVWSATGGADEANAAKRDLSKLLRDLADKVDPSALFDEKRKQVSRTEPAGASVLQDAVASLKPTSARS
jgi:ribosomal protein L16 Arg81 hydroxylase